MIHTIRLSILLSIIPALLTGQNIKERPAAFYSYNPLLHARASNGAITVVVDKLSGRFAAERPDGTALLFTRNDGMTSFTNVRIDGRVFTNNTLNGPQTPDGTTMWPTGDAADVGGKVVYRTLISQLGATVELRQEFIPMLDQDYAFIRIVTSVTNLSNRPVRCGSLLMMDLMLGFEDYMQVRIDSALVTNETGYAGPAVPAEWSGSGSLSATRVRARLRGSGLTPPDRFVVGRWQYDGYLGAASWDYPPSGLRLGDDAVLMQWDEGAPLNPQETRSVATDYGYIAAYSSRLTCSVDPIRFDELVGDYSPNPFPITATVTNTGDVDITNVALQLDLLPPQTALAAGESAQKTIAGPIPSGQSAQVQWRLKAGDFPQATNLDFTLRLTAPARLLDTCRTSTIIPATPHYTAALDCGAPVILQLDAAKTNYANNPFPVSATLRNTGNMPLDSLYATITLPSRLQLVGTPRTLPVSPVPLQPGQSALVAWNVAAIPDTVAETVTCAIGVSGRMNVRASCSLPVTIPAIVQDLPCAENGTSTRGTDFWFASPPNPSGNSEDTMMLFMTAAKKARVTVYRPGLGAQTTLDVYPGALAQAVLETFLNDAQEETVERRSVHVVSDVPISLYFGNLRIAHSDATMILPTHALGRNYMTVSYQADDQTDHFIICGTADGTHVTVVPAGSTNGGKAPGVPFDIDLNAGETYYIYAALGGKAGGLTGTTIASDKPVAVIGGGVSGWIPFPYPLPYGYLNPHFDEYPPLDLLGMDYVAVPFRSRRRGDTFKIVATQNQTSVTVGSNAPVLLSQAGDTDEETITEAALIHADKPVIVAQFANSTLWDYPDNSYGDGSMVILSPANRLITCHAFPTGLGDRFDSSFVNVVVPEGVQGAVSLDGARLADTTFHPVPNGAFLYAQLKLDPGIHFLETSDTRGIGAIVYGFDYHDAFTFNSGFLLTHKFRGETDHAPPVRLLQNYPNPFNPSTGISFVVSPSASGASHVLLTVHDAAGREVARLADGEYTAGSHVVRWDAGAFASGVYTCRIRAGGMTAEKRMVLLK